ncbi:heme peroxidase [Mycena metata]|uniref:Peroxidase n=1 Tax=Mycena metata TaxID=1033252 RepID=A0AAD7IRY6_9AGAR|nr:heme peroxidase [Mycena metata]
MTEYPHIMMDETPLKLVLGAAVFNWPDPLLDTLDDQLYLPFVSAVSTFALNCTPRDNSTIAAQWLRLAYHDMATHDSATGTGGLDTSIIFEFDRPQQRQDIGAGMLESLVDFLVSPNEYVGMADVIAMGAINAVVGCGGPVIPFRDLASHIASFKAQGFNETEMISLVACGHSLGGVRVKEYLDGTTENVLVVGSNVTTRSDLRIFSSDSNVTMQSLASPDTFNQVCSDLIGRMLDTVPSTVTLTEPIEPLDFKVTNTLLFPQGGSLAFLATLRIIDTGLNRSVTMFWKERTGTFCPPAGCAIPSFQVPTEDASFLATLKGVRAFKLHSFNAAIDLATSISHFWFEVNNNDGSAPLIVGNHGANFAIDQDVLVFDPRRSSFTIGGSIMVVGVRHLSSSSMIMVLKCTPDGYTFYTSPINFKSLSNTIHATVNGTAYSLWVPLFGAPGV